MDEITTCDACGHSHPDEVAPAWGLPDFEPLCANCWSFLTEINEAFWRGDMATVDRLTDRFVVCV